MIKHHPSPELLTAFSAGSLSLSYALCISTHIDLCQECRSNVRRLKMLGADMFNQQRPEPAADTLKQKVLAGLLPQKKQTLEAEAKPLAAVAKSDSQAPRSLHKFVGETYAQLDWHSVSPSIKSTLLCRDGERTQVSMLKLAPGSSVGHHGHMGEELTLILEGSFSDEDGMYQRGDFLLRDGGHRHKPVASKDGHCICLTVQDAPIQFTGYFSRLLNPFLRKSYGL